MRPIDADALIAKIDHDIDVAERNNLHGTKAALNVTKEFIEAQPTIGTNEELKKRIEELLGVIEVICRDGRERSGEDWYCGLCEYDGPAWQECPGFEKDDCFTMREDFKRQYLDDQDEHGSWEKVDPRAASQKFRCSSCGAKMWKLVGKRGTQTECKSYYCPTCGAPLEVTE